MMHLNKIVLAGLFLGILGIASGQPPADTTSCFNREMDFVNYLYSNSKNALALTALSQIPCSLSESETDSVNFMKGWIFYNLKQLDSSSFYFLKISEKSATYHKAQFFAGYNYAYTGNYAGATGLLNRLGQNIPDSLLQELKTFELAGIELLKKDTIAYNQQASKFTYQYYALTDQEKRMDLYLKKLETMPRRSPVMAGVLSAVVPGLGRWYAGRKKQAIGSFFQLAALGLLTWEAYDKHGPTSAPFYIYGSAFTIFYLSNIRGSAVAVKIKRNEDQQLLQNSILFDMHIPLRTIFN